MENMERKKYINMLKAIYKTSHAVVRIVQVTLNANTSDRDAASPPDLNALLNTCIYYHDWENLAKLHGKVKQLESMEDAEYADDTC